MVCTLPVYVFFNIPDGSRLDVTIYLRGMPLEHWSHGGPSSLLYGPPPAPVGWILSGNWQPPGVPRLCPWLETMLPGTHCPAGCCCVVPGLPCTQPPLPESRRVTCPRPVPPAQYLQGQVKTVRPFFMMEWGKSPAEHDSERPEPRACRRRRVPGLAQRHQPSAFGQDVTQLLSKFSLV